MTGARDRAEGMSTHHRREARLQEAHAVQRAGIPGVEAQGMLLSQRTNSPGEIKHMQTKLTRGPLVRDG